MLAYVIRRLGVSAILLLVAVLATFLLHHALPGDPAAAVLGKQYTEEGAHEIGAPAELGGAEDVGQGDGIGQKRMRLAFRGHN